MYCWGFIFGLILKWVVGETDEVSCGICLLLISPIRNVLEVFVDEDLEVFVKSVSVQDKLEEIDSNSKIANDVANLRQGNLTDEEFALHKKLYVCYLRVHDIYEEHVQKKLGIRRKRHLNDLLKSNQSGSSQSVFSSGTSSFTVLPTDTSSSLLTSDLASQPKIKPPQQTQKGKK